MHMTEHRMDAPGQTPKPPAWLGSYNMEIRRNSVRLPKAWRPKKPLPVVRLVCESADNIRMVWLISREQLDQQQNADADRQRILAQDEILLKPNGLIRLPDAFLEGFSNFPDAQISLVGMDKHIEIYRQEDPEKLEDSMMTVLDALCQYWENTCRFEDE